MGEAANKLLIIGLGNPILTDDAIGWRVAAALREKLRDHAELAASVEITEACLGGLSLAELMVDYTRVIVIDAIMTRDCVPGTVYTFKLTALPGTLNTASAHDTNLATALGTLRRYGGIVPDDEAVDIVAVEAAEVMTFSETCTPAVEASIVPATEAVFRLIQASCAENQK
ncbi:MAG: hydrogenase maturation protease [Anaerolineae bacterium]|nr:hydrogenase maturation protease [Anaerolineae bacterium]